ncbi:MAG: R3H domain-containing nucleic acid-binding protein [Cyanobacteriota bacterium]|nr:R3H domain-containing nucleic acid-binding protein [Cyanobacteriota bacterium]
MSKTQIEIAKEWLEELLKLGEIPATVTPKQEEDSYWLTIDESNLTAEQISILIGKDGLVIDAIQYLANTILNISKEKEQELEEQASYTIEINDYRNRRIQELQLMADYAANQVRLTKLEYEIPSLSSAERRQVHTILKEHEDLETYSRGQEPDRRLVVKIKD